MQSKVLLPNMSGKIDFIGEPVKAIGYDSIKTNKRSQTICLYTTNKITTKTMTNIKSIIILPSLLLL